MAIGKEQDGVRRGVRAYLGRPGLTKILFVIVLFLFVQDQIRSLRDDLRGPSGKFALALDRYEGEINRAREELHGVVANSEKRLRLYFDDIQESAASLEDQKSDIALLVSRRGQQLHDTINIEFSRYEGALERMLSRSESIQDRMATVERRVESVLEPDPLWMERSIIYPIAQLKGDGTVGSGVLIYSAPRAVEAADKEDLSARSGKDSGDGAESAPHASYIVTACHVVMEILGPDFPGGELDRVRLSDPASPLTMGVYSATVEIYDEDQDLALLRLVSERRFPSVARLFPRDHSDRLRLFSLIYAVGCPLGNNPLPSTGEISSRGKRVGAQTFWMINAPTFFGNSGGGIFLRDTCELIGISSMIYTYGKSRPVVVPHMGLFVPIDNVREWLENEGFGFIPAGKPAPARS